MVTAARILREITRAGSLRRAAEALGLTVGQLRGQVQAQALEPHVREILARHARAGELRALDRAIRERAARRDASTGRRREAHQEALARLLARRETLQA